MKLAIFDIEGTTSSIAFVYERLFPYARNGIPSYVRANWDTPELREVVRSMGVEGIPAPTAEGTIAKALELMDGDVKDTGLKMLQGLVWKAGYGDGDIRGHVFADVPEAFRALDARGVKIAIYSSGSVAAQLLIFGNSEAGDLTTYIAAYFDTTTGPKKDAASYTHIVASFAVAPADATFFTDNLDEARAARAAGLAVRVMARPGNPPLPADHGFEVWSDFASLT